MPIRVAAQSKAWNALARSNTRIIGSNPTRSMDIYIMCVYSVLFCAYVEALRWADPPSKESYRLYIGSGNSESSKGPTKSCRAIIITKTFSCKYEKELLYVFIMKWIKPYNLRGCNVGITDARGLWTVQLSLPQGAQYTYHVSWRSVQVFK
jgi:hypothetical protein